MYNANLVPAQRELLIEYLNAVKTQVVHKQEDMAPRTEWEGEEKGSSARRVLNTSRSTASSLRPNGCHNRMRTVPKAQHSMRVGAYVHPPRDGASQAAGRLDLCRAARTSVRERHEFGVRYELCVEDQFPR